MCRLSWNLGASTSWNLYGPVQACNGIALPFVVTSPIYLHICYLHFQQHEIMLDDFQVNWFVRNSNYRGQSVLIYIYIYKFLVIFYLNFKVACCYVTYFSHMFVTYSIWQTAVTVSSLHYLLTVLKTTLMHCVLHFWIWIIPIPCHMVGYFSCRFDKYPAPQQFTFLVDCHIHRNLRTLLSAWSMKALECRKRKVKGCKM
jgi:hypothetical protein